MGFETIDNVVDELVHGNVGINTLYASDDQLEELAMILEERTTVKPFNGNSYLKYMTFYRQSYPILVCDNNRVHSFTMAGANRRPIVLTASEVLGIAGRTTQKYSDSDFDEVL